MGRGTLRIFLGSAPGVGKTYAMLRECHRLREAGEDVVVAPARDRIDAALSNSYRPPPVLSSAEDSK